jgi:hypothetical protein
MNSNQKLLEMQIKLYNSISTKEVTFLKDIDIKN